MLFPYTAACGLASGEPDSHSVNSTKLFLLVPP
jgi:hypothetical protein